MATDIVMPRLSDSMEEGTILTWLKSVGDEVRRGDELVEIETDKANMVYEADVGGTVIEIIAAAGATLPIGTVIARVGEPGESIADGGGGASLGADAGNGGAGGGGGAGADGGGGAGAGADQGGGGAGGVGPTGAGDTATGASDPASAGGDADPGTAPATAGESAAGNEPAVGVTPSAQPSARAGRVKASPVARRIAREAGVELAALSGSGPGGRIVKADVERALQGAAPAGAPAPAAPANSGEVAGPSGEAGVPGTPGVAALPPGAGERPETAKGEVTLVELTKVQQTVARRMAESKATAPHFYLNVVVDMSRAVEARSTIGATTAEGELVPSFNDMVVKACAIALREFPRANGAYRDGRMELYSRVNVGVAVAASDALVVPTVFDADRKGLRQIAAETRSVAARVRDGSITPPELSGGTFTVSNLGMYGIDSFSAVINPPQAGILAVGAIAERPVARDGEVSTAQLMDVGLACDHRILYGAEGARFLARIRELLEEPVGLAL